MYDVPCRSYTRYGGMLARKANIVAVKMERFVAII